VGWQTWPLNAGPSGLRDAGAEATRNEIDDKLNEALKQVLSTRSVGMNLARPFKAGKVNEVFASRSDALEFGHFRTQEF
jgi:hypothetical protein